MANVSTHKPLQIVEHMSHLGILNIQAQGQIGFTIRKFYCNGRTPGDFLGFFE